MALRRLVRRLVPRSGLEYDPEQYWESRSAELVAAYDSPETWERRGWMRGGIEEAEVPAILKRCGAASVVVPGAGSGRQYAYLLAAGFEPSGFDISPRLVETCRARFDVPTHVGNVVDADRHQEPADAVVCSAVLQHVEPAQIEHAVRALQGLARRVIVIRELTELASPSTYQFAHDYDALFSGWREVHRRITDERPGIRVELVAWTPR